MSDLVGNPEDRFSHNEAHNISPLSRVLYFVLQNPYSRDANETKDCPKGICPYIKFTLLGGDATDADCRDRIYTPEQMAVQPEVGITTS